MYKSFVNVYQFFVFHSFPFGFEGGMWDLIVSIADLCLSISFILAFYSSPYIFRKMVAKSKKNIRV